MTHRLLTGITRFTAPTPTPPGPTVLILDQFTDADGTLLPAHTIAPTNTPGNSWVAAINNFVIDTNKARPNVDGSLCVVLVESGVSDCTVSAIVRKETALNRDVALVFRSDGFGNPGAGNYYNLDFYNGAFELYSVSGGTFTLRASDTPAMAQATDYTMSITGSGNDITATLDGLYPLAYSSAYLSTETKHGIYASRTAIRYNDFKVTVP